MYEPMIINTPREALEGQCRGRERSLEQTEREIKEVENRLLDLKASRDRQIESLEGFRRVLSSGHL